MTWQFVVSQEKVRLPPSPTSLPPTLTVRSRTLSPTPLDEAFPAPSPTSLPPTLTMRSRTLSPTPLDGAFPSLVANIAAPHTDGEVVDAVTRSAIVVSWTAMDLNDAFLFPDVMNSQLERMLERRGLELKQEEKIIPELQQQVSSVSGQLQLLKEEPSVVRAENHAGNTTMRKQSSSTA